MKKFCRKGYLKRSGKRSLALLLSVCLIGTMIPVTVRAESGSTNTGLCEHHTEHTAECGYVAPVEGHECEHVHDDSCGYQEASECTHEHTEGCGENGETCSHEHTSECGYAEEQACNHVHDEKCGYVESSEGSPCTYVCDICGKEAEPGENNLPDETLAQTTDKLITAWQWKDEEGILDEETGSLSLPGASEEMPAYFDDVISFLPTQIQATVESSEETEAEASDKIITLGDWTCEEYPKEGAYSGSYTFAASLPEGYALSEEVEVLEVPVELGGAQTYESTESQTVGAFTVITDGVKDTDYTYADGVLTIKSATPITIANADPNTSTTDRIEVESGIFANITLAGVNVDVSSMSNTAAFKIADGSGGTITLADNSENTLKSGENCAGLQKNGSSGTLTIKGGENGTGELTASGGASGAGIGGGYNGSSSEINISGGKVTATGGGNGAGIGGGQNGTCQYIYIHDGKVTATGGGNGAGIGGGQNGTCQYIYIHDGTVTATGGASGAGIGGGNGGSGSNITIIGGTVTATGGGSGGAGIGGGYNGFSSEIHINGGTVTATGGGNGAGIGGGNNGFGTRIYIGGGTVTAEGGGNGAGIGGGNNGVGSEITISGGSVKVVAGSSANAIGGGYEQSTVTPTSPGSTSPTSVYPITIANPGSEEVLIDGVPYTPVNHKAVDENDTKLYAYLSGQGHAVQVGEKNSLYMFDSKSNTFVATFEIEATNDGALTYGTDYTYIDNVLTIKSTTPVTIKNVDPSTATTDRIEVADGVGANITLAGVNIDVSSISETAAFKIADDSTGNVTITLADETVNTLKSGVNCAGLQKNGAYSESLGKLTIQGGENGKGKLIATGGNGAGIGGGNKGSGSNIEISGGTVTANSGAAGAGIGGGNEADGSNITISGGSVKANGENAIGGGASGNGAITPTSDGSTLVYLFEIKNDAGADIIINDTPYPTNHNEEKKIYAYLPAKTVTDPNVVQVGTEITKYIYDTKWLVVPTVTAPVAVDVLVYTGQPQELVTAGTTTGGEIVYALEKEGTYSETIPTGTDAGTYNVWYKSIGDGVYADTSPASVSVTIEKATVNKPESGETTLYYTGKEQTYTPADNEEANVALYTVASNTAKEPGSYEAVITLKDTANYKWAGDDNNSEPLKYPFRIEYYDMPDCVVEGTKGDNGWYTSVVKVKAPEATTAIVGGFLISTSGAVDGNWVADFPVTTEGKYSSNYWLKTNDDNGYISKVKKVSFNKDATLPEVKEVKIKGNNIVKQLIGKLTFGYFFKDKQTVTITSDDVTSGVNKTWYYLSDKEFDKMTVTGIKGWTVYENPVEVAANKKFSVYVKVQDNAGNITYTNSDGVVIYTDSVADTKKIEYTRTTMKDVSANVNFNENTIKSVINVTNNNEVLSGEAYKVDYTAGTITFAGAYLDTLPATTYAINISYNPYDVTYQAADYNEAASDTAIELVVKKHKGYVSVTAADVVYNEKAYVSSESLAITTSGTGAKMVEYKLQGEDDDNYTTTAPTNAGNYVVRVTVAEDENYLGDFATDEFKIKKARWDSPSGDVVDETIKGKADGKWTIRYNYDATDAEKNAKLEYKLEYEDVSKYKEVSGTSIENLAAGDYCVRRKGDDNHEPSLETPVEIVPGPYLTVSMPAVTTGYSVSCEALSTKNFKVEWHEGYSFAINVNEKEYHRGSNYKVLVNNKEIQETDGVYVVSASSVEENQVVKVEGVEKHTCVYETSPDNTETIASIIERCSYCNKETGTVTIKAPEAPVYDGTAKEATIDGAFTQNQDTPEIKYAMYNDATKAYESLGTDKPINAGKYQASITVGGATATVTYEIDKASLENYVTVVPYEGVYDGSGHGISVTVSETAPDSNDEAVIQYRTNEEDDYADANPSFTDAGTYTVYYKVSKNNYNDLEGESKVVITQKPVTITAENKTKTYGQENPTFTFTMPDGALVGDDTKESLGVILSCVATKTSPVKEEGYAITGTSSSVNYKVTITQGTLTIAKADATINVGTTTYDKTFGDADFILDVTDTNTEANVQYEVTAGNDVVSVSNGTVTILKAGTATITISLPASTNYNAADSKTITVNVAKKSGHAVDNVIKKYTYLRDNADTIDLSGYLPANCGAVTYGTPQTSGTVNYTVTPAIADGKLSYTVKQAETYGATGTIKVTVTTDNYADFTITVNAELINQLPVSLKEGSSVTLQNSTLTYGEALSKLTFNSAVFVDNEGNEVAGTLTWKTPDKKPTVGTTSATWLFTPDENAYADLEDTVAITVKKATPDVTSAPTVAERTYDPDVSLKNDELIGGTVSVGGSWSWKSANIIPTVNNSGYVAVFTPTDSTNYETVNRTITVTVNKATPVIKTAPTAAAITYGDNLAASALTGGNVQYSDSNATTVSGSFAWKDAATKPNVSDSSTTTYQVIFTPSDTGNCNTVETTVTLTVNKAENAPNMPSSTMNVANSCEKVSDVTLPTGWVWQDTDKNTALTVGTAVTATAEYNGADKGNYENETVSVTITRSACEHAHTELRNVREATCTEIGYTGDTYCTDCETVITAGNTIPLADHQGGTATCSKKAVCTVCGKEYGTLDANNHVHTEIKGAVAATCTAGGYTGDTYCTDCGVKTKTGTATPALGHNYTSKVTTEPTTEREGVMTYTCDRCGHSYTRAIAKLQDNNNNPTDNKPEENKPGGENTPDTGKPYIKDETGKEGWEVIKDEVDKTQDGDSIVVEMNGSSVVPGDVLDEIKGEDVTIVFDMGNGITWSVNGQSITSDKIGDIDFSVTIGTTTIPTDVINNVTGERYSKQISLAYDGEFGFTAVLSINMDKKNVGLFANLFYFNEKTGKMEFICYDEIAADGTAELVFNHASDYAIVIDTEPMDVASNETADTNADASGTSSESQDTETEATQTGAEGKSDAWNPWWIIVIGIMVIVIGAGVFFVVKKKENEKE